MRHFLWIFILALVFTGCEKEEERPFISLEKRSQLKQVSSEETTLKIALGGIIRPKEGFKYYEQLLQFIGQKLGIPVEIIDKKSYAEINQMLENKEIDVAFSCSGPYVEGHERFGLELLVIPQAYGKTTYNAYILAHKDSPIQRLEDLRGKRFAFTDPHSNTGRLVPTFMLSQMKQTPEKFFSKTTFTYAHDKSIQAVAEKVVEGASVHSLIWEYANSTDPIFTKQTKIIARSDPYGIPPVVVRPGLKQEVKERLKKTFLSLHEEPKSKEILEKMKVDRFVEIEDAHYNTIREMKQ
ncbi:MAG: phosphate/phosphite/phosphonate ABC transporter substrate-binding protein [Campylobacterota bacterium]|nr:phosphate/phosphite/phosphonate ABC transporter substrate-binding protein [Campylobacterota bacterium]